MVDGCVAINIATPLLLERLQRLWEDEQRDDYRCGQRWGRGRLSRAIDGQGRRGRLTIDERAAIFIAAPIVGRQQMRWCWNGGDDGGGRSLVIG